MSKHIRGKNSRLKQKGMWMGGVPPLGYRVAGRQAPRDRAARRRSCASIFRRYAELGSVRLLKEELDARGIKSKSWTSASGRRDWRQAILARRALPDAAEPHSIAARSFTRDNPIPANTRRSSISRLWDAVQAQLADQYRRAQLRHTHSPAEPARRHAVRSATAIG